MDRSLPRCCLRIDGQTSNGTRGSVRFLSPDGGGPTEGGGRDQNLRERGVGVAKEVWTNQSAEIQSEAEERLGESQ